MTAEEQIKALVAEVERRSEMIAELLDAMRRYQMDSEDLPPNRHRDMIRRAEALTNQPERKEEGGG